MDEKQLKAQLDELQKNLEAAVNEKNQKAIEAIQTELKALADTAKKYTDLQEKLDKIQKDAEANQKALDKLIAKGNDIQTGGNQAIKTLGGEMYEELTKRENDLKQFKE
jgi:DNA repair exonuclease SbcCD ATPase subunit